MTVCGPTVTVPARAMAVVLRATCSATVPERLLAAVAGTAIQDAALTANQLQPVSVSTVIVTSPPSAEIVVFAGPTL